MTSASRGITSALAALVALLLVAAGAIAHPALGTVASLRVSETQDGPVIEIIVTHDVLAYALNDTSVRVTDPQMYALLEGPRADLEAALQDGRERFQAGFNIFADDQPLDLAIVQAPSLELMDQWLIDNPARRLPVKMDFIARADLPMGTKTVSVRAPMVFDQVILGVTRPRHETTFVPLEPGETSPKFDVSSVTRRLPTDGTDARPDAPGPRTSAGSEPGVVAIAWRYIKLGYEHIIPEGRDHELFILGLFLLNARVRDVLWQTTTFTIAHTCTITLATLGWVHVPSGIVEPIIAASIAFIAIENLFTKKTHPWRPAVAFIFGLFHGLGFAAGLMDVGLPTSQLVTGILAFNVGVECGHITILAAAFAMLGWWRKEKWFRPRVAMPFSGVIACIALFWFAQRLP